MNEVANIIRTKDNFLLATHVNPDGDAIGSLLGMYCALKEMGKTAYPVAIENFPNTYSFLCGCKDVITDVGIIRESPQWIISLDAAEESRIAGDISRFRKNATLINIDHHPTNPRFGQINYVDAAATSTSEIVHLLLKQAGYSISSDVGKCLYTGIITDTGGFRFSGVTARTFQIASEVLSPGFDVYEVTRYLYEEFPLHRVKLEGLVLERIEEYFSGSLFLSCLYLKDFDETGASISDTENLVNRLREVQGVRVGVLLTQVSEDATRVSFRAKDLDVSLIAKELGGGGHRYAAGVKSTLPFAELKSRIIDAIGKAL
jgi:bifunctional oligoribonuclease and PAP phosphatase NrnA